MAVLPVTVTRRAYLNIVLLVSIMIFEIGFIVPLARQPEQCFDPVTPHGMEEDRTCAVSGGFAAFGGVFLVVWVMIRSLFMHLQICWDTLPGKIHYLAANIGAISVTIALTAATLAHAGVSYRFGGYCHVNVGSISTYWGWLLGFAGFAFMLQIATFVYCIKVYLSSAWNERNDPSNRSSSIVPSSQSRTARATARRVRKVLVLQWRSLAIVTIAVFTITFVCIFFIVFDDSLTVEALANPDLLIPWLLCIIQNQDAEQCTGLTGSFVISEGLAVAALFILAFVGVEAFLLLVRLDFFKGWWELIKGVSKKRGGRKSSENSQIHMTWRGSQWTGNNASGPAVPGAAMMSTAHTDRSLEREAAHGKLSTGGERGRDAVHAV